MENLVIKQLQLSDEHVFLKMTLESKEFHHPWVQAPVTHDAFVEYFNRSQTENQKSYLIYAASDLVGVFNINEIVRGYFQSGYLGFYGAQKHAGKGLMSQGLKLVLKKIFDELSLHRIEANIQPMNFFSVRLVQKNGFKKEGYSPKYLKINGEWCDHERWALTVEDWKRFNVK